MVNTLENVNTVGTINFHDCNEKNKINDFTCVKRYILRRGGGKKWNVNELSSINFILRRSEKY